MSQQTTFTCDGCGRQDSAAYTVGWGQVMKGGMVAGDLCDECVAVVAEPELIFDGSTRRCLCSSTDDGLTLTHNKCPVHGAP